VTPGTAGDKQKDCCLAGEVAPKTPRILAQKKDAVKFMLVVYTSW